LTFLSYEGYGHAGIIDYVFGSLASTTREFNLPTIGQHFYYYFTLTTSSSQRRHVYININNYWSVCVFLFCPS